MEKAEKACRHTCLPGRDDETLSPSFPPRRGPLPAFSQRDMGGSPSCPAGSAVSLCLPTRNCGGKLPPTASAPLPPIPNHHQVGPSAVRGSWGDSFLPPACSGKRNSSPRQPSWRPSGSKFYCLPERSLAPHLLMLPDPATVSECWGLQAQVTLSAQSGNPRVLCLQQEGIRCWPE